MKHFFESLERSIDYQKEYNKIEEIVICEEYGSLIQEPESVERWLERNFRFWKMRGSFTTFAELRDHLGFGFSRSNRMFFFAKNIDINRYFLYCEMLMNLSNITQKTPFVFEQYKVIFDTITCVIEKSGFEIKIVDSQYIIVEKNPVAIEVSDIVPELSDVIIEYNHYLLRGDMERKKEILKRLADSLEPKREELAKIDKNKTHDFFFMVNNMNVRHNNCDMSDVKHYQKEFATLSVKHQEGWYDMIYEQALTLYVLLNQDIRSKEIKKFKDRMLTNKVSD